MSGVQLAPTRSDHEILVKWYCWKLASDCCINPDHPQTDRRTLADSTVVISGRWSDTIAAPF
jgi:hypothetical protein